MKSVSKKGYSTDIRKWALRELPGRLDEFDVKLNELEDVQKRLTTFLFSGTSTLPEDTLPSDGSYYIQVGPPGTFLQRSGY